MGPTSRSQAGDALRGCRDYDVHPSRADLSFVSRRTRARPGAASPGGGPASRHVQPPGASSPLKALPENRESGEHPFETAAMNTLHGTTTHPSAARRGEARTPARWLPPPSRAAKSGPQPPTLPAPKAPRTGPDEPAKEHRALGHRPSRHPSGNFSLTTVQT